uniref:Uncharacterized protein n=1 Tax=Rhizophora mucronata TaxID=61149 RepID=A0A2P2LSD4_RHIMU
MFLVGQFTNYFKIMGPSRNRLSKIIRGRFFLVLPTYMEEVLSIGILV